MKKELLRTRALYRMLPLSLLMVSCGQGEHDIRDEAWVQELVALSDQPAEPTNHHGDAQFCKRDVTRGQSTHPEHIDVTFDDDTYEVNWVRVPLSQAIIQTSISPNDVAETIRTACSASDLHSLVPSN